MRQAEGAHAGEDSGCEAGSVGAPRRGHRATPSMDLVGHTPGRMDRRTHWADADLLLALDGYEEELSRAALSPITVQSYVNHGRRFLRWRIGDYVPRGMPMPAQRPVPAGNRDLADLTRELGQYKAFLGSARLQPGAIGTYVRDAARFVHWLGGKYAPRSAHHVPAHTAARRTTVVPAPRATRARPAAETPADAHDAWDWEGHVVDSLVTHLESKGWQVVSRADPAAREHGVDLLVARGRRTQAIEVKGWPAAVHASGAKAGQPKRWRSTMARNYMGDLVLSVLLHRHNRPDDEVALAVPDRETFTTLLGRLRPALELLGIGAYVVHEEGRVEEVLAPARRSR